MKVLNIHTRIIQQPKEVVAKLLTTLATPADKVWPKENWPAMKFKNGLKEGNIGFHGPIKYSLKQFDPANILVFDFIKPVAFIGIHKFEISKISDEATQIKHTIDINTNLIGSIQWFVAIRWLHDALIEDAFDKVENQFNTIPKNTDWNPWVIVLRKILDLISRKKHQK